MQKTEDSIVAKTTAAREVERRFDDSVEKLEELERRKRSQEDQLQPLREAQESATESLEKHTSEMHDLQAEHREIKNGVNLSRTQCENIQKAIDEEQGRLAAANGDGHAAKLAGIDNAERACKDIKDRIMTHESALPQIEVRRRAAELKCNDYKPNVLRRREELSEANRKLQNLQQDQGQQDAGYDRNLNTLLKAIRNETRFREKPVGPLGYHVRLKTPEWSSVLERTFGNALEAFVVTSKADQYILSELIKRCRM